MVGLSTVNDGAIVAPSRLVPSYHGSRVELDMTAG